MNTICANDLKTKGFSAILLAQADQPQAPLTVRSQMKYLVKSCE